MGDREEWLGDSQLGRAEIRRQRRHREDPREERAQIGADVDVGDVRYQLRGLRSSWELCQLQLQGLRVV